MITIKPITGEKVQTILKSVGLDLKPYWSKLFAKAIIDCDLGGRGGSPIGGISRAATEKTKEKSEPEEEECLLYYTKLDLN